MRVLVTGHRGYIGSVLVPLLLDARPRGHRPGQRPVRRLHLRRGTGRRCPSSIGDVRDVDAGRPRGLRRGHPPGRPVQRPAGRLRPAADRGHQPPGLGARWPKLAKEAGVERFLFACSCSNYGGGGQDFLDETRRVQPGHALRRLQGRGRARRGALADDDFSPIFLRASTAYGVSPRIRFDLVVNNLTAWAFTTGEVHLKSDGSPWRPLVHVEDIARAYVAAARGRPRRWCTTRPSTWAPPPRTTGSAKWPRSCTTWCRTARSGSPTTPSPDKRCYRVDCNLLARTIHGFKPQWTVRRGVEQLLRGLPAAWA